MNENKKGIPLEDEKLEKVDGGAGMLPTLNNRCPACGSKDVEQDRQNPSKNRCNCCGRTF